MRLIDADALPKLLDAEYKQTMKLIWEGEKHLDNLAEGFTEASHIAKYIAPTVDAVPVVRCKDCKHYKPDEYECGCDFAGGLPYVKADDFCSYGERRDYD
ncbi:MAG: hypothetical protein U0I25_00920 [Oscillospiraceae bacterium]|nr:hypothetical protein [Oscillospiraceae bacterium]